MRLAAGGWPSVAADGAALAAAEWTCPIADSSREHNNNRAPTRAAAAARQRQAADNPPRQYNHLRHLAQSDTSRRRSWLSLCAPVGSWTDTLRRRRASLGARRISRLRRERPQRAFDCRAHLCASVGRPPDMFGRSARPNEPLERNAAERRIHFVLVARRAT